LAGVTDRAPPPRATSGQLLLPVQGVQCLASMTLFTQRVNVVRIAMACFPLCPLRLCGSRCRI
jgi:hypothetical protein